MSRALSNIVQSQIVNLLNRSISDIKNLATKVDILSSNNATLFNRLARHETGIDVHNLRELILDALNENMLVNPALESYELDDNVPDGFSLYDGLEGYSDNGPDYSIYKHGEKSFRMSATYDGFGSPKEIYLSQTVERVFYDGEHTVSFYHTDNGADNFEYVCRIVAYDEYGQWLETIDVPVPQTVAELEFDEEEEYLRDNAKSTMRRHSAQVELPAGIRKAELHVGIRLYPGAQDVTAWFDYFMLSQGNLLYRPPELVEGVLQTKHISTNGLDAKVIKTGQITITENLELATKDGRIRMHFDEAVGGNVIDFLNEHDQNLIRLGKYGIQQNEYGLIVRDEYNRDTVKINASGDVSITGHIEALSGKIGEHIYLDGEMSRVTVKKGDEDVVAIGKISDNVYGIDIKSGQINIGDGEFSVTSDGRLTARSANISGEIHANTGTIGGNIFLDGANSRIIVYDDSGEAARIGRYGDNKFGVSISKGEIHIGNFSVTDAGVLTAVGANISGKISAGEGSIGGFTIGESILKSTDDRLVFDSSSATVTLSPRPDYKTTFGPSGVYGTVPLWRVPSQHYDPANYSNQYYVKDVRVKRGSTSFNRYRDYEFSGMGEVIRLIGSNIPEGAQDLTFEVDIYDEASGGVRTVTFTSQKFEVTTRASAIITDDSLLDATFVKNLIIGSAQIGHAVIMDGHIANVSADKIHAGTITLHQQLKIETNDKSIVIDDSGIKATHGGQPSFRIGTNGEHYFRGEIYMERGYILDEVIIGVDGPTLMELTEDVAEASSLATVAKSAADEAQTAADIAHGIATAAQGVASDAYSVATAAQGAVDDLGEVIQANRDTWDLAGNFEQDGTLVASKIFGALGETGIEAANSRVKINKDGITIYDDANMNNYIRIHEDGIQLWQNGQWKTAITSSGIATEALLAIDAQVSNIYVGDSIFLNGDGFTIKHGGTEVFRADLQGNLKIKGELQAGSIINGEAGSIDVGPGGTIQVGNRIKINKDGIIARNQADTAETFRLNANTGEIDIRSGRIRGSVTIGDSDTTMQDVLDGAIGGLDEEDVIRVIQDTWGHVDNRTEIDGGHIRARTISAAAIGAGTIILNQGPTQDEQLDIRTSPSLSDGVFMNSTGVVAKKNNVIQSGFDVDGKWFAGGNLGPGGQQTYAIEADRDGFRAYSDSGDEIFIIDLSPTSDTRNKVIVYGELRATKLVLPVR